MTDRFWLTRRGLTPMARRYARITADDYWYTSPAADAAIHALLAPRRQLDPRRENPSLSSLQGAAKRSAGSYLRTRARVFAAAGVVVEDIYVGQRRVGVIRLPGEPRSAAIRVERAGRGLARLALVSRLAED